MRTRTGIEAAQGVNGDGDEHRTGDGRRSRRQTRERAANTRAGRGSLPSFFPPDLGRSILGGKLKNFDPSNFFFFQENKKK